MLAGRLRVRSLPLSGQESAVHDHARNVDAAGVCAVDPELHAVLEARLAEHIPALDGAILVRQRFLHLPVPSVLYDGAAGVGRSSSHRWRKLSTYLLEYHAAAECSRVCDGGNHRGHQSVELVPATVDHSQPAGDVPAERRVTLFCCQSGR